MTYIRIIANLSPHKKDFSKLALPELTKVDEIGARKLPLVDVAVSPWAIVPDEIVKRGRVAELWQEEHTAFKYCLSEIAPCW